MLNTLFTPSRRLLLAGGAATMFAGCSQPAETTEAATEEASWAKKVGIQLYTLRNEMGQDFAGTLRRVAEIGYDEVEFAGYYDNTPAQVKQILDEVGLTAPSAHVALEIIRSSPAQAIEAAQAIGHTYMTIPWLPEDGRRTLDQYRAVADTANSFGQQAQAAGLKVAYHNHDFEFVPIDGVVPFDLLLERTDPNLVKFELDLYWARKANRDILQLLQQHGPRITMCHVKDMDTAGNMADVGAGTINFAEIFAAHEFEHYFVERDDATDPFATATASYSATRALLG